MQVEKKPPLWPYFAVLAMLLALCLVVPRFWWSQGGESRHSASHKSHKRLNRGRAADRRAPQAGRLPEPGWQLTTPVPAKRPVVVADQPDVGEPWTGPRMAAEPTAVEFAGPSVGAVALEPVPLPPLAPPSTRSVHERQLQLPLLTMESPTARNPEESCPTATVSGLTEELPPPPATLPLVGPPEPQLPLRAVPRPQPLQTTHPPLRFSILLRGFGRTLARHMPKPSAAGSASTDTVASARATRPAPGDQLSSVADVSSTRGRRR